ncbi:hypothetical protein GA0070616_3935 [Micromonospora nigra]|uniref:Uncharacterized protein n=1 Tax=Micromonospora nigra TaxID=145857 RepID=A0A1C6SJH0_9ACTN|nr:hypothetical protein [Micromonospora nigra]SCL29710.1 hypothetical protein GA0070616_3935 [Micromonospora nigra]
MRAFFRYFRAGSPRPAAYRAAIYRPSKPWQVRERRFTRRGRRGVDVGDVTEDLAARR